MLWSDEQRALLQFVNVVHLRLVNSLLDDDPHLVVDRIEVGAVYGHKSGRMKAGVAFLSQPTFKLTRYSLGPWI